MLVRSETAIIYKYKCNREGECKCKYKTRDKAIRLVSLTHPFNTGLYFELAILHEHLHVVAVRWVVRHPQRSGVIESLKHGGDVEHMGLTRRVQVQVVVGVVNVSDQ